MSIISDKGILILSHAGPKDPDKAILPIVVATMAKVSRIDVTLFLLGDATYLLTEKHIDEVKGEVFPSLREAYDTLVKEEIEVHICSRYMKSYGIKRGDFAGAVKISSLARLAELAQENSTLTF